MAKKKIEAFIKLQIPAGQANPSPPVGPALGQKGVNIMEFCKAFNAATQGMEAGMPIPVTISVFGDRSFKFITKTPPVSYLIKKAIGLKKGSSKTGLEFVGKITWAQIKKIAEVKMQDLNANDVEAACRMVAGTAVSMGVEVIEEA